MTVGVKIVQERTKVAEMPVDRSDAQTHSRRIGLFKSPTLVAQLRYGHGPEAWRLAIAAREFVEKFAEGSEMALVDASGRRDAILFQHLEEQVQGLLRLRLGLDVPRPLPLDEA